MASVGLFVVGSAIGKSVGGSLLGLSATSIGGAIGGAVGSWIDANYLFPPSTPDVSAPRVDDYSLQISSEGGGVNKCFGPENKCTGSIIWIGRHDNPQSDLTVMEERKSTQTVGGKGSGGSSSSTSYSYYVDLAVAVAEGPVNAIRVIWADSEIIYSTGNSSDLYEALYLYTGSEEIVNDSSMLNNTIANSHIEAFEGSGNVPKYKNTSYFVVDSLNVDGFGQRIPTFNSLVESDDKKSVASTLSDILIRAGLDSSQFDVSRVKECLTGYYVTGPVQSTRVIEPILQAYDILVAEVDSVLHFFHRGDEHIISLDVEDLGSIDGAYPLEFSDINDLDKPSSVAVNYIDAGTSYDRGQEIIELGDALTPNQDTVDLPLVLSPNRAATVAARRLYRHHLEDRRSNLRLPPSYLHVTETDVLQFQLNNENYRLRVTNHDRGASGAIELSTTISDSIIDTISASGSTDNNTEIDYTPYIAPLLDFEVVSIPALVDTHVTTPIYLVSTSLPNSTTKDYRGSVDYESGSDTTSLFVSGNNIPGLSIMGTCTSALGGGVSPDLWDYKNEIHVTVNTGELSSATKQAVAAGANHCLVGNEIVGFTTATLIGANQYMLTGLLRGRRHTFSYIDNHNFSERFILLDSSSLLASAYSSALIGTTRFHRVVATGGNLEDVSSKSVVLDAATVKPFSPTLFSSSRDGSNNLSFNWTRRTRSVGDSFSSVPAPVYEGQEVYEIDILVASGSSTIVRTIVVTDSTSASYTAVEQISDGLIPGNPVYAIAYMTDLTYGRGWPSSEITL